MEAKYTFETFEECKNEISNIKTLTALFDLWKNAHEAETNDTLKKTLPKMRGKDEYPGDSFKSSFCCDGVTSLDGNVPSTANSKVKVLFILKESNLFNKSENIIKPCENNAFWFNENINDATRENYKEKIKYVLDKLKVSDENFGYMNIGYMNINKRGGYGGTTMSRLRNYAKKYREFIIKQIELHNPDIVVCCGCFGTIVKDVFEAKCEEEKYMSLTHNEKTYSIYNIWHLSNSKNAFENSVNKSIKKSNKGSVKMNFTNKQIKQYNEFNKQRINCLIKCLQNIPDIDFKFDESEFKNLDYEEILLLLEENDIEIDFMWRERRDLAYSEMLCILQEQVIMLCQSNPHKNTHIEIDHLKQKAYKIIKQYKEDILKTEEAITTLENIIDCCKNLKSELSTK